MKVLRPGIERAFLRDVDAFHFAATMIEVLAPFARRLRPRAVINHFEGVVQGELDLRMEAAAAAEFAANSRARPRLPGAGGDLGGLGAADDDARVGRRASISATSRRCRRPTPTSCGCRSG